MATERPNTQNDSTLKRLVKLLVSVVVLVPVTVFLGYGGGVFLTLTAKIGVYDPTTADGEPLRRRLFSWPDRNREVMRTNGRAELPLKP
ncbi:hypothetical protein RBH26_08115 [Natronolimnohabitans sp. A-GB9]|uniref:hypothetical protein n=1 Tax=Natronolimnohabitans sp. A-GB9 TaxID=3069757 RepID=UPI0027ADD903|nr:hypothetical protein [Natronolimnohabitans sp. A-GB9]MDQ2050451.1 hypothetical protein [Natronolimnohabitans sp. A-GB9]